MSMSRIVHVTNFGRKPKGAFQHSVEYKISNGLIRNGHYVSNFSDRDAARSRSWLSPRKSGIASANKALREFCYNVQPDLLLLGHADVIKPKTLVAIRQDVPSLKILQWNVDPAFEPDNIRRISSKLEVVDATLVSTAGDALAPLTKTGKGAIGFLPNPVDFSIETGRNDEKQDLPYDLFYPCGNPTATRYTCGENWLPDHFIQRIQNVVPEFVAFYRGVKNAPIWQGRPIGKALESAAIGLNLSRRNDFLLYSSDRLAHMCGNGMTILWIEQRVMTGFSPIMNSSSFLRLMN